MKDIRRKGRMARFQRQMTGRLIDLLRLRRGSDAPARRQLIALVNLVMALAFFARSTQASSGTEGASFLNIPVGARPAAMGGGYTALAEDAYAPTYNPSGLGFVSATELSGQHLAYLESIHYEYLSLVHPLAENRFLKGALGFSVQYLGSGDIQGTDASGNETGEFSAHYASYNFSYGRRLTDKIALGTTLKWIQAKLANVSANAVGFDFGALYHATDKLSLATTLTNLGSKLKFIREGDSLPLAFHVAAAYRVLANLDVTGEAEYRKNGLAAWHMGAEWRPMQPIALRVGYRTDTLKELSPLAGLGVGMGVKVMGHELSYAWVPYGELGNTQYVSINLRFGGRKKDMTESRSIRTHQVKEKAPQYQELMELMDQGPATKAVKRSKPAKTKPSVKKPTDQTLDDLMLKIESESNRRMAAAHKAKRKKS